MLINHKAYYNVRYVSTDRDNNPQSENVLARSEFLNNRIRETGIELYQNEQEIKSNNENIKAIHEVMKENLNSTAKSSLIEADNRQAENITNLTKELTKEYESRFSGVSSGEIKRDMVQSEIDHSRFVKNVLDTHNVNIPEDKTQLYNDLIETQDRLNERNSILNEEQTDNYSTYYEFSNTAYGGLMDNRGPVGDLQGSESETLSDNENVDVNTSRRSSLVDDYADPSTEQPSHMDPED
jgi:hypothetical protein